jgi:hypothetical protein
MFISGSLAACTSPATLSPVSGCVAGSAFWVVRSGAVAGLVLCFPSAVALSPVAVQVAAAAGLWHRVRRAPGGVWVLRIGLRSRVLAGGVAPVPALRAVAVQLVGVR